MFNHTQSQPPKYELLPESMVEIFKFYSDVRDPYELNYTWISHRYSFPETSGMYSDSVTKKWIMSYMAVLFLRQYTIIPYLITMKPLDFPTVPTTQGAIKQWIDGLDFFRILVSEHLQNSVLLKTLNLDFITEEWCNENQKLYPLTFIDNFKLNLEQAYKVNAETLPISAKKVSEFENATKNIIESTIKELKKINNSIEIKDSDTDKWYVNGQQMLQDKDAFSENPEVYHIDFESFLSSVVSRRLKNGIGETFGYKKSKSFLLKPEEFFKAVDNLGIDENYIIVNFGVNIDFYIDHLKVSELSAIKYKRTDIYSLGSSYCVRDSFFILKKSNLPDITTRPIDKEIITKYTLKKISDTLNLYSSVIDLNETSQEIFNENKQDKSDDELKKSVLLSVIISTEIKWKKNIEVIQLRQYSEFYQEGVPNKLDDVKLINNKA